MAIIDFDEIIDEKKGLFKLLSGTHSIGRTVYKPGDKFKEYPSKVEWMKHRLERLDEPEEPAPPARVRTALRLKKEHRGGGKYNVVNETTGQPINDRLLTSKEADDLIAGENGER